MIIDAGAHHVLSRRESGGRLLAAGVIGVIGAFSSGQAVRIVIRKIPEGVSTVASDAAARASYARALALETTRPSTPSFGGATSAAGTPNDSALTASSSLSSSMSSLEDSLTQQPGKEDSQQGEGGAVDSSRDLTTEPTPLVKDDRALVSDEDRNEWTETDVIEVGRGLANYNSEQILRVKGLNRCESLSFCSLLHCWPCRGPSS